jgi:hypothetical protein
MAEIDEVFEMTTKQMEPDQDAWNQQERRQRRTARNRKVGALAVAGVILLAMIAAILAIRPGKDGTIPADEPTLTPTDAAVEIAMGFLQATNAYDADRAFTYLADNADLTGFIGAGGAFAPGAPEGFRLQIAWDKATGHQEIVDACEATTTSGTTVHVLCTYAWNGLRSDEIGLGPYGGASVDLIVRDGKIVGTGQGSFTVKEFSPQVWEPFAAWVSTTYPKDAAVMYDGASLSNYELTEESIRLWEKHTKEYVKMVNGGTEG